MALSKKEERTLYDSIYVDLQDLLEKVVASGCKDPIVIQALKNARITIPTKAVRLLK